MVEGGTELEQFPRPRIKPRRLQGATGGLTRPSSPPGPGPAPCALKPACLLLLTSTSLLILFCLKRIGIVSFPRDPPPAPPAWAPPLPREFPAPLLATFFVLTKSRVHIFIIVFVALHPFI